MYQPLPGRGFIFVKESILVNRNTPSLMFKSYFDGVMMSGYMIRRKREK
jgi:hypothetical protein